jgi:DNA-binding Lrp family transcriptional regulator
MGETPYRIFFTVHPGTDRRFASFIDFLAQIPEVHWVGTLIGYYQIGLQLRASSFEQLRHVLDSIDQAFGAIIVQKEYAIISELTFLSTNPVRQKRVKTPKMSFRATSDQVKLDEVDRAILTVLRERPLTPLSELGRALKMPTNTVTYRFKNLVDKQVILGFFYSHDERRYGFESYLLLVSVMGLGTKAIEQLRIFALQHSQIIMFTTCTGRWDFEFEVVVSDVRELQRIVDGIHTAAQGAVRDVLIHAWGHDFKG